MLIVNRRELGSWLRDAGATEQEAREVIGAILITQSWSPSGRASLVGGSPGPQRVDVVGSRAGRPGTWSVTLNSTQAGQPSFEPDAP